MVDNVNKPAILDFLEVNEDSLPTVGKVRPKISRFQSLSGNDLCLRSLESRFDDFVQISGP